MSCNGHDLFISYATGDKETAFDIVSKIEAKGYKCFIAPRDIKLGADYAQEIVGAISSATAVLLVYSENSNQSGYVLREINSAVSHNKTVIPFRIASFTASEAMEFYLGVTHWLDAFPEITDVHINSVISIVDGNGGKKDTSAKTVVVEGPSLVRLHDISKIGFDYRKVTIKEIELDYLCVPTSKFEMNEEIEGTFENWENAAKEYEDETSILLVKNDEIIGYCDFYPVNDDDYEQLIAGKVMVRDNMIELFSFGGEFNAYIGMVAVDPEVASQSNYMILFDWIIRHIFDWKKEGVVLNKIGISVYSDVVERFVKKVGFNLVGLNPAKGKVYETSVGALTENAFVKSRYSYLLNQDYETD